MTTNGEQQRNHEIQSHRWAVVGGSGFVGRGVVDVVGRYGAKEVRVVSAPRVHCSAGADAEALIEALLTEPRLDKAVHDLVPSFSDIDVVVNAAGLATPDAPASPALTGANALLPIVIAKAAEIAGVRRLVHLSSVAVQGRVDVLNETSKMDPFSAYSQSKASGELALRLWTDHHKRTSPVPPPVPFEVVILRATSVQGAGRGTSSALRRIATSRLASIAAPGTQPSVVSSLQGLSEFVTVVGAYPGAMPQILIQPWEGASVQDVLELAGNGRTPIMLPRVLARIGVKSLAAVGQLLPRARGIARRVEVMWFGQDQVAGWAADNGLIRERHPGPSDALRRALNQVSESSAIDPEPDNLI